ncbi:gamma-aminobutyric acid type B receptor subunit 2-like [Saccoglossus kowalevskii]|uniref:Gamma-aminobutyric acid type B receptor subunit 2-like n=1 Tax=Saccoglossus kowalevskii TaxID=10224 RepID=A0ABM0LX28_SACKO|nr:PREDICTED: gamma-aminobutyric acid type B receptor subunit 2-like [Saccoglossus kowalevskii]
MTKKVMKIDVVCEDIPLYISGFFITKGYGGWAEGALPAASMALDDVNKMESLLVGYKLEMNDTNTQGDSGIAMRELIHQLHTPPTKIMILGPTMEQESLAIAETSRYWNLAQMGFSTVAPELSNTARFPLYYRTRMPQNSMNPTRIGLMEYFGWERAAIFYSPKLKADALTFMNDMVASNKTVVTMEDWTESITDELKRLKNIGTRIFHVFVFNSDYTLRELFCEAYKQGLYQPRYAWIVSSMGLGTWWNASLVSDTEDITCTTEEMRLAAYGTIVVKETWWNTIGGQTTYGIHTDDFRSDYLNITSTLGLKPAYFAPLVYDAVWSIAYALNTTRQRLPPGKALEDFTYEDSEMAEVITSAVSQTSFIGVSGPVSFNSVGDRIGTVMIYQFINSGYILRATNLNGVFNWNSEFTWTDSVIPPDRLMGKRLYLVIDNALFYSMCGLAIICLIFATCLAVFNVMNRDKKAIRMSSPKINGIIIIGAVLAYISIVVFGLDCHVFSSTFCIVVCQLRVWLICLGFTIGFGAMFSKTWRIHKIFTNKKVKSIKIQDAHLLGIVLVLISVDVIILVLWTSVDPLRHEERELPSRVIQLRNNISPGDTITSSEVGTRPNNVEGTTSTYVVKHSSGSCLKAEEEVKKLRELYRETHDELLSYRRKGAEQVCCRVTTERNQEWTLDFMEAITNYDVRQLHWFDIVSNPYNWKPYLRAPERGQPAVQVQRHASNANYTINLLTSASGIGHADIITGLPTV